MFTVPREREEEPRASKKKKHERKKSPECEVFGGFFARLRITELVLFSLHRTDSGHVGGQRWRVRHSEAIPMRRRDNRNFRCVTASPSAGLSSRHHQGNMSLACGVGGKRLQLPFGEEPLLFDFDDLPASL